MSMNWSYDVQCGNLGKSQALTNEYSTSMYIQCGWLSFVKLTVSAIWIFSRYVETAELHPRLNNTSYIKSQKKVANGSKNPCAQRYRYRDRKIIFFTLHHWQRKYKSQEQKKKTSVWYDRGFSSSGYGQDRLGNIFSNCKRFHISSCNYFLTKSRKNQFIYVGYACSEAYCFCLCEPEGCPLFS